MSLVEKKNWYLDYLLIIVGTGLMALAINSVFDATGLVTGGFSGIAILVKHWTGGIIDGGVPLWLTNITLNIPLFFLGWRIKGFSFVKKALVGEISLSTWLAIQPVWNIAGDDLLLAAVYGGVILGIGRIVGETAAHRNGFPRTGNHRRNGYDGSTDPEVYASLFHRTDHAVY